MHPPYLIMKFTLKPPSGCPCSQPNQYRHLIRSLYDLKWAPLIFYNALCSHLCSLGLRNSPSSPCLLTGHLIDGAPPIYIGIYVNDIIYFSSSDEVKHKFEKLLGNLVSVDFMGQISHFLGIEFSWKFHDNGNLTVNLTQQSFAETLIESLGFDSLSLSTFTTPYRSGCPIDSIPNEGMSSADWDLLHLQYQSLVGSLNWLAHTTCPDLSAAVSLLAQHQSNPSSGHLDAAKYVVKYLAGTKTLGVYFTSKKSPILESFLQFPLPPQVLSMSDANWAPQDVSQSKRSMELPIFMSRSMSTFYIDLLSPLHWLSKRQLVIAGSSAEAEIYAMDECVKLLLELVKIMDFLGVKDIFMPSVNTIFNDNQACVNWSKQCTSKGLRHIQMKENRVSETIEFKFIVSVCHINGKLNIADIFTKEMKDVGHFVTLHNLSMCPRLMH